MKTIKEYYSDDGTIFCVDNYLREIARTPKRKTMSRHFRTLIAMARNILYNSGAHDFVRLCDALDIEVKKRKSKK